MDNIFFIAAKIGWFLIEPDNILVALVGISLLLYLFNKDHLAKKWFYVSGGSILFIAIIPIGSWLIYPLETQFPVNPHLPEKVDGIILLGGSFLPSSSQAWGKVQTNRFADRIHDFLALIHQYPNAKAIFTGGSPSLNPKYPTEAFYAEQLFTKIGIPANRILFESKARNTYENIVFTKKLVNPKKGEVWVVISTAFHLPRTIGIFCQNDWSVIPYPADFHTNPNSFFTPDVSLHSNLQVLNYAAHEWLGLIAYYVTGKTHQLLPENCT